LNHTTQDRTIGAEYGPVTKKLGATGKNGVCASAPGAVTAEIKADFNSATQLNGTRDQKSIGGGKQQLGQNGARPVRSAEETRPKLAL
jgi:hypothetical protein